MKKINVLALGDSITYGVGDHERGGWVNRLRYKLEEDDSTYYDVYNLGIPGDNSSNLMNRMINECRSRVFEGDTVIVIQIGANDTIYDSIGHYISNLKTLLDYAFSITKYVVVLGLCPAKDISIETRFNMIADYSREKCELFDRELQGFIKQDGRATYIKIRDRFDTELLVDGVHPNEFGHEIISNVVYKYLDEVFNVRPKKLCCLCNKPIIGNDNNPWPLKKSGRCCNECNMTKVIIARLKGAINNE